MSAEKKEKTHHPSDSGKAGESNKAAQGLEPVWRYVFWWLLLMAMLFYVLSVSQQPQKQEISYSQFKEEVRAGQVASVTLRGQSVTGRMRPPEGAEGAETEAQVLQFRTTRPPMEDPELLTLLEEHNVQMNAEETETAWWQQLLIALLPWVLIIGLFVYGTRRLGAHMSKGGPAGGLFGFAKSKAKRFHKDQSQITFDDVAGLRSAKQDLHEITAYLKDPARYRKLGAKIPKGILLMGPPGTGKTLLAKAVAGEAEVPFYSISGSEFIEMFVGIGASRVRDMFESAKKEAPAIIFIDEIDSVGRARGAGLGGGHDEREQTLNQILGEMDGFAPHEAVVVLAATNRPDVLDAALLRPGRFDRKVTLDLPDKKARRAILEIHSRNVPLAEDVDLERVAALTVGFSGADLENLVNEAALLIGRERRHKVDMAALTSARDRIVLGAKREMFLSEEDKKMIAYHEAGHAVAALLLPHADPLDRVTIVPRGRALGATEQIPEEERHNLRQSYVRDRIGVMLGGRIAEQMIFGEVSSGSAEDLKQATRLARLMISQWGMSDRLGPVTFRFGEEHVFLGREIAQQRDFSEATAELIDQEVTKLTKEIERNVAEQLSSHRNELESLADMLLERETLEADEIREIVHTKDTKKPRLTGTE